MTETLITDTPTTQELPPVPNVIDAYDQWNQLPYESRQEAFGQFFDAPKDAEEAETPSQLEQAAERFLETGQVQPARTLQEVADDVKTHPEDYSLNLAAEGRIVSRPPSLEGSDVAGPTSEYVHTEGNAILELQTFLLEAQVYFTGSEDHKDMAELSRRLLVEAGFMSEKDLNFGVDVIAHAWIQYMEKGESHIVNVWNPERYKGMAKSEDFVYARVVERVSELLKDKPELASRLRLDPEQWEDSDDAMLVILEDWVLSGVHSAGHIKKARVMAEKVGKPGLEDRIQLHVLMAKQKSVADMLGVDVKAVFNSEIINAHDVSFSGSHSIADYGFMSSIKKILESYRKDEKHVFTPHLISFARRYNQDLDYLKDMATEFPNLSVENQEILDIETAVVGLNNDIEQVREQKRRDRDSTHSDDELQRLKAQRNGLKADLERRVNDRYSRRAKVAMNSTTIS